MLESDGLDRWGPREQANIPSSLSELAEYAMRMGLAGLGGAGFPTGLKLGGAGTPDLLLINGAECEPFLTCDDRLMRERAADVIQAADYLAKLSGVSNTFIGVESNKPEAIRSLRQATAAAGSSVKIRTLPARYPAGGQPMLVRALSGRRLRPGQLPAEIGVQVLNVASLYALGRAVFHGEPLISRVVTLTGRCKHPGNYEVPLGYPVNLLRKIAEPDSDARDIHVGGPMMGRKLEEIDAVTGKTSSCLIFGANRLWPAKGDESDCIRCNRCVDACPMALQPMSLLEAARSRNQHDLKQLRLDACIECGACSQVCPSNLPLRDSFRAIKKEALICRTG
ncbi:hypothetical protein GCM10009104_09950 [Marinobacterium maritimum]|uniref:Ion-translocating oxidoreductase complex subunit C n=1 Tax=Marinobacterium maritimum TaxID=500162 RepID=A0ABN1I3L2_9GAMM